MTERYKKGQTEPGPYVKRRKVSPDDIQALQKRAEDWAHTGGPGRAGVRKRAQLAYQLSLDFLCLGILGTNFPKWLSLHSGVPLSTCKRYRTAGRAIAAGAKPNRNQSGLIAEQRQRERTPITDDTWGDDGDLSPPAAPSSRSKRPSRPAR